MQHHRIYAPAVVLLALVFPATGRAEGDELLQAALRNLEQAIPRNAADFSGVSIEPLREQMTAVRERAAAQANLESVRTPDRVLTRVDAMAAAKHRVDHLLNELFQLRHGFTDLDPGPLRDRGLQRYLQATHRLIDLSGRMNYFFFQAVNGAAYRFAGRPPQREKLIEKLSEQNSAIGADVMSLALLDPPPNSPNGAQPASPATKAKLLRMIAQSGNLDIMPMLAEFVFSEGATPALTVQAAETIRKLGLPQEPRSKQTPNQDLPSIAPAALHEVLSKLDETTLSPDLRDRRRELLRWLSVRMKKGLVEDRYRVGNFEVKPGDWLLTRNPSPYNLFTNLSPGLFTHVGIVTTEIGPDGKKRMVAVEMRERGTHVPATNIEIHLRRTLHYVVLRHPDAEAARTMGDVARSVIGNKMKFDLDFETSRVTELKGKPLAGETIHTYCAGILLLCAQETGFPREEFFPIREMPRGKQTAENLAKLGIRLGNDFVSPTGPLFATRMKIVGTRETMYHSGREIEQAVFDHFGRRMVQEEMQPGRDLFQSLRLRMAEMAKQNDLLAKALAASAGVSSDINLVSAAKAVAAVETLDEIAYGASRNFRLAFTAVRGGTLEQLRQQGYRPQTVEAIGRLRQVHADLRARSRELSDRQLRLQLVEYYIQAGQTQIDRRFFGGE